MRNSEVIYHWKHGNKAKNAILSTDGSVLLSSDDPIGVTNERGMKVVFNFRGDFELFRNRAAKHHVTEAILVADVIAKPEMSKIGEGELPTVPAKYRRFLPSERSEEPR